MQAKVIALVVQFVFSLLFFWYGVWLRRHLPEGSEAGWFRGAVDGMNVIFYMFGSKDTFMTHPHSWAYSWFYWTNAIVAWWQWGNGVWKATGGGRDGVQSAAPVVQGDVAVGIKTEVKTVSERKRRSKRKEELLPDQEVSLEKLRESDGVTQFRYDEDGTPLSAFVVTKMPFFRKNPSQTEIDALCENAVWEGYAQWTLWLRSSVTADESGTVVVASGDVRGLSVVDFHEDAAVGHVVAILRWDRDAVIGEKSVNKARRCRPAPKDSGGAPSDVPKSLRRRSGTRVDVKTSSNSERGGEYYELIHKILIDGIKVIEERTSTTNSGTDSERSVIERKQWFADGKPRVEIKLEAASTGVKVSGVVWDADGRQEGVSEERAGEVPGKGAERSAVATLAVSGGEEVLNGIVSGILD